MWRRHINFVFSDMLHGVVEEMIHSELGKGLVGVSWQKVYSDTGGLVKRFLWITGVWGELSQIYRRFVFCVLHNGFGACLIFATLSRFLYRS